MSTPQTAITVPRYRPNSHRRTDRASVDLTADAYLPLKALAEASKVPMYDLLDEAIALLLLERSEPVPPALRAKVRVYLPEPD